MKKIIINSFKQVLSDRKFFVLLVGLILMAILFAIITSLLIQSSDVQLITRYSAFGITHLYRNQWYYLLLFVVFLLAIAIMHVVLSAKLLIINKRSLAIMYTILGYSLLIISFITFIKVINIWTPLN